jgi:hypothetical protein
VELADGRARNWWTLWILPQEAGMPRSVRVTRALDAQALQDLRDGGKVILLADGSPGSFLPSPTWMLRGGLWFPPHVLNTQLPHEFYLDLVVKDLHPRGLLRMEEIAEQVTPIVAFWETHDLERVVDSSLVLETRVGEGRLLVSSLDHDSAAGRYLLQVFAEHLESGPAPATSFSAATIDAMVARLTGGTHDLTAEAWSFRPGGGESSAAEEWSPIAVGRAWESCGFPDLDGWATYRLDIDLPVEWHGEPLYLNFEGVDDAFEVYFDGRPCGSGGDIGKRRTAFAEASAHQLTASLEPGSHRIEVRVFDWYGAGGIHRPVRLSTRPLGKSAAFLVGR